MNNTPKRFMLKTTQQRMDILDSVAESKQQDRSGAINESMLEYILINLNDPELVTPIKEIFSSQTQLKQ